MSCCHAPAVWDEAAVSLVCSCCGSLQDVSQSLLVPHDPPQFTSSISLTQPRAAWVLSGQEKDARNRKNAYLMSQLINSIAASLTHPGLSPRAIHIFNQAMSTGLRWGRQAKRASGASVALALREANLPHHLHDIASLLNEPFPALSRVFLYLASLLRIKFKVSDPSIYLSSLQSHLYSLLQDPAQNTALSASLIEQLRPLDFRSVVNTTYPLSTVLTYTMGDARLTPAPTACAIFLLALESEARCSLHNISDLALYLGAKHGVGKGVVMSRYKLIQDEVASWIEQVPWLDKYTSKGGRAKVSKRTIVARGLKDALEFRQQQSTDGGADTKQDRKRRKLSRDPHQLKSVAAFLLTSKCGLERDTFSAVQTVAPNILSRPNSSDTQPLTRLQRLAQERGGSDVLHILDDELFAEGELESMLRTREEMEIIKPALSFEGESLAERAEQTNLDKSWNRNPHGPGKNKRKARLKPTRVDISAFEQFMGSSIEQGERDDDPFFGVQLMEADSESGRIDPSDPEEHQNDDTGSDTDSQNPTLRSTSGSQTESETVVDQWRPLSPQSQNDAFLWLDSHDNDE
ncbi:hypothetical protein AX15_005034 [Amanita polypyramis BW_CC]|nr:hypothetical protein AX15_005034 [Amanita polypyramis BW_CC]